MKKTDKILKAASVFEKLAHCENKQAMKQVIKNAQPADAGVPAGAPPAEPPDAAQPPPAAPAAPPETTTNEPKEPTPPNSVPKFQPPASLKNKSDVLRFQQDLSEYVKQDPNFNHILTKALGGIPWGQGGRHKDVDGIPGERTTIAFNEYRTYATKMNPAQDLAIKRDQSVQKDLEQVQSLREKLQVLRSKISENTKNFTVRYNTPAMNVQTAWMPYFKPEFDYLLQAKKNKTLRPEIQKEFDELYNYMAQLFNGYMKTPPEEPKSSLTF